ncbi:MAG: methionyl-tRNA formyltransferase [bacterium]
MNIGFLGTPEISAHILQELFNKGFNVKWVATQPDKESGRGRKMSAPAVKDKARSLGLDVLQSKVFDRVFFEEIQKYGEIDLAIVVAYGLYLPTYFLKYPKNGCINVHFSLLPKYRGAAPVARAIMNGEKETGISIMKLVKEMDAGDIIAEKRLPITVDDTTESLTWTLAKDGAQLLIESMPLYLQGKIIPVLQSSLAIEPTYAEKIDSKERFIDWNKEAETIHNMVRALYPWPVAETKINGVSIKIIKTKPIKDVDAEDKDKPVGSVIFIEKKSNCFFVKTSDGALLVEKVQPSGKREMTVSEFLNGYDLKKGMRFE